MRHCETESLSQSNGFTANTLPGFVVTSHFLYLPPSIFLKIIIGMYANHLVKHENLLDEKGRQMFFLTPSQPEKPTTIKKRSFLQAQFKKSGIAVSEVKDHIVASRDIFESRIERIDGE